MEEKNCCKCNELLSEIKVLVSEVQQLKKTCNRMDEHISFVQSTYNIVRQPASYVLNRVSSFMGLNSSPELPEIENGRKDFDK